MSGLNSVCRERQTNHTTVIHAEDSQAVSVSIYSLGVLSVCFNRTKPCGKLAWFTALSWICTNLLYTAGDECAVRGIHPLVD